MQQAEKKRGRVLLPLGALLSFVALIVSVCLVFFLVLLSVAGLVIRYLFGLQGKQCLRVGCLGTFDLGLFSH